MTSFFEFSISLVSLLFSDFLSVSFLLLLNLLSLFVSLIVILMDIVSFEFSLELLISFLITCSVVDFFSIITLQSLFSNFGLK